MHGRKPTIAEAAERIELCRSMLLRSVANPAL
jgi:hypothetical protein